MGSTEEMPESMIEVVLFLDIDGPCIPRRAWQLMPRRGMIARRFDPVAVAHLKDILYRSRGRIVITSTKANLGKDECRELFEGNDLLWTTHVHEDWSAIECADRSNSILEWLGRHPEVKRWAALDDENLNVPNFVRVTLDDGVLTEHIRQLEALLVEASEKLS